ncbi:MAG TPA: Ig-like domain-containing protein [Gemmatimonadaceae bacterium]|nr:Ig-like domain-containing protein [Gemmatimonadaceae bacterium]
MRKLILLAAVLGCAQIGSPPGGPEDHAAPHLLRVSPDTNALNARPKSVQLQFDEIINERPSRGGDNLSAVFLVSPKRGRVDVKWHRSRIEIRPRRGWMPNTTYVITQLPGVADLRGNADSLQHQYIFSTGPTRAESFIRGVVFDWATGQPAPKAYVEAIHLPDSLTYGEYADSLGRFVVRYLPPGRYLVRGIIDANSNRVLDRRELFDSATVVLTDSASREMLAFVHDSIGAGLAEVEVRDSVTLRSRFDRPLQPGVPLPASRFSLRAADSSVVPIVSVTLGSVFEKEEADSARAKAVADSIARARQADSIARANPRAARPPAPAPPPAGRPGAAARDTTPRPKMSAPVPETYAILKLGRALTPGTTYRLRADSLRSLMGIARTSDRVFIAPRPRSDSTRPPGDSARRPDSTRRPPPRVPLQRDDLSLRLVRDLFAPGAHR